MGETVLEFLALSDEEAEALASVWFSGEKFRLTASRFAWYEQLHAWAERKADDWHKAAGTAVSDDEKLDVLQDYLNADRYAKLLLNAFVGHWSRRP